MNRILIFSSIKGGHFAEWIQHLLNESYNDYKNKYYFVIPYDKKQLILNNNTNNNVNVEYIKEEDLTSCNNHNLIVDAYRKTLLLKRYAKKYNTNKIFLLSYKYSSIIFFFTIALMILIFSAFT